MTTLRVAHRVRTTTAEGPGTRYALWVQGCSLRCAGCCNPEMFSTRGGEVIEVARLVDEVLAAPVEGVSLLGGEPFEQAEGCAELARAVRAHGRSVMVFTGYTRDEVAGSPLLESCDLLVDGRYERDLPDETRRWIGSTNQRMHFLTERYRPDDPCFRRGNEVILRLTKKELSVHGWPAAAARVRSP